MKDIQTKQASGTFYLNVEINSQEKEKPHVLVWENCQITYITYRSLKVSINQEFVKILVQKLNCQEGIDAAINAAMQKVTTQTSIREFLELLVKMRRLAGNKLKL